MNKQIKTRYRIRRITDGKFLFPLKYFRPSYAWSTNKSPNWSSSGRNYTTYDAAKNELDRELDYRQQKGAEIIKVIIEETFEVIQDTPKLEFNEWLQLISSK